MTDRPIIMSGASEFERFMSYVSPEPNSGCWLWVGAHSDSGYGRFGQRERAHRASLRLHGREIPQGFEVDHLCRVRCCVNPDHLDIVTHRVNMLRGETIIAKAAAKTHCPAGHLLAGENISTRRGGRDCLECDRLRRIARYQPTSARRRRPHLRRDEVELIRKFIQDGASHSQIARQLGVSIATVSNVRRGANKYD